MKTFMTMLPSRATVAARLLRPLRLGSALNWTVVLTCVMGAAASLVAAPDTRGLLGAALAVLMIHIANNDARRFIIPNEAVAAALALALVQAAVDAPGRVLEAMAIAGLRAAVMGALFFLLREAYWRIRGREGLGLGDVKLAGVAGAWLEWTLVPAAIEIAALAALALYLLRCRRTGRHLRATSRIPFGLFLAPSIWICWLLEVVMLAPR